MENLYHAQTFLTTLVVLLGWACLAPTSWLASAHAQINQTLTMPAPGTTTTITDTLAGANSLNPAGATFWAKAYSVALTSGNTYCFNMAANNGNGFNTTTLNWPAQVYILDPNGNNVSIQNNYGWDGNMTNGTPGWNGSINASGGTNAVLTVSGATGNYTIICTTTNANTGYSYPLMFYQYSTGFHPAVLAGSDLRELQCDQHDLSVQFVRLGPGLVQGRLFSAVVRRLQLYL